jgi:serine/threonine-protein kinase HipA
MRKAMVYLRDKIAGTLIEDENGYSFSYDAQFLASVDAEPISLTMPLSPLTYKSNVLFQFFDGLIPEGWLLDITVKNWKINPEDRMGLLMTCCKDCIGAVGVVAINEEDQP